ncbi:MAG: hypothetical protein LCH54_13975 [Bacteroidetes bacterium]|nr:hypothetical protein [Bacteroidota bacterium]
MITPENKERYILLENLFNLYFDEKTPVDNEDFTQDELNEIDQVVKKNILLFKQLKTKSKAELNRAKHSRVKEFLEKLKSGIDPGDQVIQQILDKLSSKPQLVANPLYRNLNNISEQDRQAILLDSQFLDILDEIEREFNPEIKDE